MTSRREKARKRAITPTDTGPTTGTRMRAVVQHEYGGPETLHLDEVERPTPGAGQVLVQVRAAAVGATYELADAPQAMRDLAAGRARGKLVVTI